MAELRLDGLRTDTLAGYLGTLGLFRSVAEQKDPDATLRFESGVPVLSAPALQGFDELVDWVMSEWEPLPIASPWNNGSGFHPSGKRDGGSDKVKRSGPEAIEVTTDGRLKAFREYIAHIREGIEAFGGTATSDRKTDFVRFLRTRSPDEAIRWIDAVFVLAPGNHGGARDEVAACQPLLGSGGNDGNLEFSNNYMLTLCSLVPFDGNRAVQDRDSAGKLGAWLRGGSAGRMGRAPMGFFDPAAVGGVNSGRDFEATRPSNPWSLIWTLEATVLFGGAATRKLGAHGDAYAAFPFQSRPTSAGHGSTDRTELGKSRAEVWLPLWPEPASLPEVRSLFSEARSQVGRRRSISGADYARAAATLGVARGVDGLQRMALIQRNGLSYFGVHLGYFPVRSSPAVDVLRSVDPWIGHWERFISGKDAPARFSTALGRYEEAVMQLTLRPDKQRFTAVVAALGNMERELALVPPNEGPRPLLLNRDGWLDEVDWGQAEVRLAASLASLSKSDPRKPLRSYLEAYDEGTGTFKGQPVMSGAQRMSTTDLLVELLGRRLLEVQGTDRRATGGWSVASLQDVSDWINGRLDESRLLELIWAFACVREESLLRGTRARPSSSETIPADLPRSWALIKSAFPPSAIKRGGETYLMPQERRIVETWVAGRQSEAIELASRRLRVAGLRPLTLAASPVPDRLTVRRAVGALLVPLDPAAMNKLARACLEPRSQESESESRVEEKSDERD